ncbi:LysR family transcriptional regulator [Burkholderia anthina]|uniref:LysR family transcriptional regulator n=1 Tax=Burkholderia anthina TaxID=179879 RepID=UPI00158A64A7|nr:LysR family transcriptional regulator [Burkholderia anthina]
MNWDNARYFLTLARLGSLRATGQALGVDQATVARRVEAIEEQLGSALFVRSPQGYSLTPLAERLIVDAEAMETAAAALTRKAAGADAGLAGELRIATTDMLAEIFVMPALAILRQNHPAIEPVIISVGKLDSFSWQTAELAVRTDQPEADEHLIRRLATLEMGLYASPRYLEKRGMPMPGMGLAGHDLVMYPRDILPRRWEALCGEAITGAHIALQVTSPLMLRSAAQAGLGLAVLPIVSASRFDDLIRIFPDRCDLEPVHIVLHGDLGGQARIRLALDALIAASKHIQMPKIG